MPGLFFEDHAPVTPSAPNRMDIALFVGFVQARENVDLPNSIRDWLAERGWKEGPYARPLDKPLDRLLDIPIPVDNWKQFDRLFAWEQRSGSGQDGSTYLGASVRSFFAQGGRRCYVVRVGDPWPLECPRSQRVEAMSANRPCSRVIDKLIPGYPSFLDCAPSDQRSWSGVGHLFGLPDVSFICLPDLAEAVAVDRGRVPVPSPPPHAPPDFTECSAELPPPPPDLTVRDIGAPRCDEEGYQRWAQAVNLVTDMLSRQQREVEFVAALPIPDQALSLDGIPQTAFLQLAYPWVRSPGSVALADNVESPDGALAGVLARNALTRGTFRSAAGLHVADVFDVFPQLGLAEMAHDRLIERVSLIGPTPDGLRLLSDATMSLEEAYRPGSVSRLVATLVRTARRIGEDVTFEPSGERVWGQVRNRLDGFMGGLFAAGALRGTSPAGAYQVRCDRSTMSQNDIDEGRLIAQVQFDAAAPIDTITVGLVINEDRQVTLVAGEAA